MVFGRRPFTQATLDCAELSAIHSLLPSSSPWTSAKVNCTLETISKEACLELRVRTFSFGGLPGLTDKRLTTRFISVKSWTNIEELAMLITLLTTFGCSPMPMQIKLTLPCGIVRSLVTIKIIRCYLNQCCENFSSAGNVSVGKQNNRAVGATIIRIEQVKAGCECNAGISSTLLLRHCYNRRCQSNTIARQPAH